MPKKSDVLALVDQTFGESQSGPACWRKKVDGDAALFLEAVEVRLAAGETPMWTAVSRNLRDHMGVRVSEQQLRRHYRGACSCG